MFLGNSFGKTLDIMHRSMDATMFRRAVIANNLANSDTPNFKRSTVTFEAELKRALESEKRTSIPAALTHRAHIPFERTVDYRDVRPKTQLDYLTTAKNNGNNVDVEEEMMTALQNQMSYDLMTSYVANQFTQVSMVLR
ncbi:MAG: flagellar basal body rod protein FlgB [Spirochaetales bacterium]|nr:flagellar basal body rod protein FlgB [Spirochaetales bacterium]